MRDDESTVRTRCFADLPDPTAITPPPYRRGSDRIDETEWVVESREHRIAPPERAALWIVRWREMRWQGDALVEIVAGRVYWRERPAMIYAHRLRAGIVIVGEGVRNVEVWSGIVAGWQRRG